MGKRLWLGVVAGMVLTVAGASWYVTRVNSSHPAPWPMAAGDAGHRNYSAAPFPKAPHELWRVPLDRLFAGDASPVIWTDGTVYTVSGTKVVAIAPDGQRRWSWDSQTVLSSLALGRHGTIYAQTVSMLYALELDGTMGWQLPIEAGQSHELAVGQGGVIYASGNRMIYAVTSDGKVDWRFKATNANISSGVSEGADGNIYVMVGSELYSLDRKGDTRWHKEVSGRAQTYRVTVGTDGQIYVKGAMLTAFNRDGHIIDEHATTPGSMLAAGNGYIQDGNQRLQIVNGKFGAVSSIGAAYLPYVWVDSKGGTLVYDIPAPGVRGGGPTLRLLDPLGKPVWSFYEVPAAGLPAVGADGRICYVGIVPDIKPALVCIGDKQVP